LSQRAARQTQLGRRGKAAAADGFQKIIDLQAVHATAFFPEDITLLGIQLVPAYILTEFRFNFIRNFA
jgi:hypothetical protein